MICSIFRRPLRWKKYHIWLLPFMVAGVLVGDHLHHKVSEYWFRLCVYTVLSIAGVVMLGSNLLKLM